MAYINILAGDFHKGKAVLKKIVLFFFAAGRLRCLILQVMRCGTAV